MQVIRGALPRPSEHPLFENGGNWAVWDEGEHLLVCARYANRDAAGFFCRVSCDLKRAVLHVADDLLVNPLRYPIDQVLSWGLLARCGGVLMHAAFVARNDRGVILAGRSGAGKSTLAARCRTQGWRGINDDRAILYMRDGCVHAAGTPWHGTGRLAEADDMPASAILLLIQADHNRLERVDPHQARLELLAVTSIPWFADEWSQGALDALDQIVGRMPVYRFYCTNTDAAVDTLHALLPE